MKRLCIAAVLATAIFVPSTEGATYQVAVTTSHGGDHWPGCRTKACDKRVGARIRERRRRAWCNRHPNCKWKYKFLAEPAGSRAWAKNTAYCETGGTMNPAIHSPPYNSRGDRYHGLGQFDMRTAGEAGFSGDPHNAPYYEQLTRMIWLRDRVGAGRWPVCG
jgi:hypothetical protein